MRKQPRRAEISTRRRRLGQCAPAQPFHSLSSYRSLSIPTGLAFANEGYVRLVNGKVLPWARMASWVCTCPIMLGMISNMALVKYGSQPLNPLMIAASLIRIVFGTCNAYAFVWALIKSEPS